MIFFILTIITVVIGLIFILPVTFLFLLIQGKRRQYSYFLDFLNSTLYKIYKMAPETNFKPNYQPPQTSSGLNRREALEILGLPESATRKQINDAYYKLVQVLHPDKGGSTYLTQKLNQARETLLKD